MVALNISQVARRRAVIPSFAMLCAKHGYQALQLGIGLSNQGLGPLACANMYESGSRKAQTLFKRQRPVLFGYHGTAFAEMAAQLALEPLSRACIPTVSLRADNLLGAGCAGTAWVLPTASKQPRAKMSPVRSHSTLIHRSWRAIAGGR